MKGTFIAFEGIDGAGKSTQVRLLAAYLRRQRGIEVVALAEPGGTPLGRSIRSLLLDPGREELDPATEVFLFMAARSHLVRTRIRPALERGAVVLCDRYLWSSVVYQGIVGGLGRDAVLRLARLAVGAVMPARTFLLDLPVAAMLRRRSLRRGADRIERRGETFQERVRSGFLEVAARQPRRIAVLDARGSPEEVHARVVAALPAVLRRRRRTRRRSGR